MAYELRSARFLASEVRQACVQEGDTVIDATLGNGHDALELASLVGERGHVYGFDVQPDAVERSWTRMKASGLESRCTFFATGHEHMEETVSGPVKYICFNLGWLPGGDKSITTHWKTTSMALSQALDMLLPGGVLSVCVYPGHEAGAEELREIQLFFSALRPQEFNCLRQTFLNAGPGSPECYIVQKQ